MKQGIAGLLLASILVIISGCAAPAPKREEVFFPDPPDLPRLQYLTSYTGTKDILEQSAFATFVAGEAPKVGVDKPYGVAVYDGKIYVCDTNATVVIFDLKKKTFLPLQGAVGAGKLLQPTNISIDEKGNKFVTDIARGQVVMFDKNDAYVNAVGVPVVWKPTDAVPYEDRLYVSDAKNGVVDVFDMKTWTIIKKIGRTAEQIDWLDIPTNLVFDNEGYLYVSDAGRFQVLKFDRDGHLIKKIGKLGDNVGNFARPRGIGIDKEKRLYVVDAAFNNVQMFDKDGRTLTFFGGPGDRRGNLVLPAKVTVDYDNLSYFQNFISPNFTAEYLVVVTSQFGPKRVNVFAFGKEKGVKYPTEEQEIQKVMEKAKKFLKENPEKPDEGEKEGR